MANLLVSGTRKSTPARTPDPFHALRDRIDSLFDDFGRGFFGRPLAHFGHGDLTARFPFNEPSVNVAETDKAYEITAELPGVDEKNIEVQVADGVLTLRGEKREEKEEKDEKKNYHLVERSYGSFQRSFALPENVAEDRITAEYDKGVLRITVPKTAPNRAQEKARRIDISAKK
ncbi:MAG: hypothetical protein RL477_1457 [Pseudomonadota bacterium]|jgi:HSP20 family protein